MILHINKNLLMASERFYQSKTVHTIKLDEYRSNSSHNCLPPTIIVHEFTNNPVHTFKEPGFENKYFIVNGDSLVIYDAELKSVIGKYCIKRKEKYDNYFIVDKKLYLYNHYLENEHCIEKIYTVYPEYKEIYTSDITKMSSGIIYYNYHNYIIKSYCTNVSGSNEYKLIFFDTSFKQLFSYDGFSLRCVCKDVIVFLNNKNNTYSYVDIERQKFIDDGHFHSWFEGMATEYDDKNKQLIMKIFTLFDPKQSIAKNINSCLICLTDIIEDRCILLPCGHASFHGKCIDDVFEKYKNNSCPCCRETSKKNKVFL